MVDARVPIVAFLLIAAVGACALLTVDIRPGDVETGSRQTSDTGVPIVRRIDSPTTMVVVRYLNQRSSQDARSMAAVRPGGDPVVPISLQTQATSVLGSALPPRIARWATLIVAAGGRYGVDPNLVAALLQTESDGDPTAVSEAHAIGLMQVIDGPIEPEANVDRGVAIFADQLRMFGRADLALAAYNAGPEAVRRYGGIPPYKETVEHVRRTLAAYARFRAA